MSLNKKKKENLYKKFILSDEENIKINIILDRLVNKKINWEDPLFLAQSSYYANQFPERLIKHLNEFNYFEIDRAMIIISKIKLFDNKNVLRNLEDLIGNTPINYLDIISNKYQEKINIFLVLLGSLLGDVFSWDSQHNGNLINNIIPVEGNEKEQLSTGSKTKLAWHTEEAFHEHRADSLGLLCLRNKDQVCTTICSVDNLTIPNKIKDILFKEKFLFLSDNNFLNDRTPDLTPKPVLFGNYESPYLRIDPFFMKTKEGDYLSKEALKYIIKEIDLNLLKIPLNSGEICLVNNHRAVHGREKFRPRYDGSDRWLKRILITRDLIKSRDLRESSYSRVIRTN